MATRLLQLLCSGFLVTAIGVLLICSPAVAGTINILSGEVTIRSPFPRGGSRGVDLVGDRGFTVNATFFDPIELFSPAFATCGFIPCPPGTPINLNNNALVGNIYGGRSATLDGVTYSDFNGAVADSSLFMTFEGNPVIAPPSNVASVVALTNPVTFSGFFRHEGTLENLIASAEATVVLEKANFSLLPICPLPGDCWKSVSATYELSPVPEPGTLLLVGTTAAGLGLARWRQRRRKQQP
jgi:hypothetical protein